MSKFLLSFWTLEGWTHIKLFITKLLIVHFLNCISCRTRSIFRVSVCFSSITNKCKLAYWAFWHESRGNVTKCTELFFKVGLCPIIRNVLYENIVENFAEVSLVLGGELDSNCFLSSLGMKQSFRGVLRFFEAYKTISSRRMVFI